MRLLLISLLTLPLFTEAQLNRSAKELAEERVKEYIVTKLFKDASYKALTFGELKTQHQPQTDVAWTISHRFEVIDSQLVNDRRSPVTRSQFFSFYLDRKMKVISAEGYLRE